MRRKKYQRNPLMDLPRVGATAAARIFGYANPRTFKRNVTKLPPIRTLTLRGGKYYILEDVLAAKHTHASKAEIDRMAREYVEKTPDRPANSKRRRQWIGPREAARIAGFRSAATFKGKLAELPEIQTVQRPRGKYYELRDVFAALFPEADDGHLDTLLIEYKKQRAQKRLKTGGGS